MHSLRLALVLALGYALLFAGGALAAKVRTDRVAGPVLTTTRPYRIEGWVVDVASPGTTGGRVILAPVRIAGLAPAEVPYRIRVTLPPEVRPAPGEPVALMAILGPPPATTSTACPKRRRSSNA